MRHESACLKGIKCTLSLMGICRDHMAEPFNAFRERAIVAERLARMGLLPRGKGGGEATGASGEGRGA